MFSARLWPCTLSGASVAISAASVERGAARVVRDPLHEPDLRAPRRRRSRGRSAAGRGPRPDRRAPRAGGCWPRSGGPRAWPPGSRASASGATTRRSHATASCMPGAERGTVDRRDDRRGVVDDRVEHALERGPERVAATVLEPAGVLRPGGGCRRRRRTPTPSPVITTARRLARLLEVAAQLVAELGVERVAALGPVDRRQPDVLLRQLPADHDARAVAQLSSMRAMRSPSWTTCSGST